MLVDMSSNSHHEQHGRRVHQLNIDFPGCKLLSAEENQILRHESDLLNYHMKAAGVVQLHCSAPSVPGGAHDHWSLQKVGVACFIKDNVAKGFFIRLFDMEERRFCWEQELFVDMKYEARMPYFHIFEADSCMAGLNFSNEDEANAFKDAITYKLDLRRARVEEKLKANANNFAGPRARSDSHLHKNFGHNNNNNNNNNNTNNNNNINNNNKHSNNNNNHSIINNVNNNAIFTKETKKSHRERKKKLTKIDIGDPMNFVHIHHVGLDKASGAIKNQSSEAFDLYDLTPNVYERAGITTQQLEDPDVKREIRRIVQHHVNSNQISEDTLHAITRRPPPPPARTDSKPTASLPVSRLPTRQLPPVPSHANSRSPAPPKPNRLLATASHNKAPLPIPQCPQPMQAVQPVRLPLPPPPPPAVGAAVVNVSASSNPVPAPPPPPPPPAMMPSTVVASFNGGSAAKPSQNTSSNTANAEPRNALLEQIRQGKALKPVENEKPSDSASSVGSDGRNALLEQIRAGKNLRPVASRAQRPEVPNNEKFKKEVNVLTDALARAMEQRCKATQSDDSETSDSDALDDEEWDD